MRGFSAYIPVILAAAFLSAAPAGARNAADGSGSDGTRPRIGLALSGGGARGLAHIGVLKVLEEEGLQAGIVTGTSMGSIVGGLYAAGYSPAFLEKMAMSVDWFDMFRETVDRRYITISQKSVRDRYLAAFPIRNGRVTLPPGIIKGQKIHRLFYRLCWPVAEVTDFGELPRDFSCVATDIVTGEPVVIHGGSLADAMRTSMAIPSAFTPVERDGRLLVDGGVVRNLPSRDAVDLGADIVICVDVGSDLAGRDSLNSVTEILDQTINILMRSALDSQKKHCDLYIRPEVQTVGTLDFDDVGMIIERGEKAARDHIEEIRAIVEAAGGYREPPQEMDSTPEAPVEIAEIRLDGLDRVSSGFVMSLLGIEPPAAVTAAEIDEGLKKLYSTGDFERISYRFESSEGGNKLIFDCREEVSDYIGLGLRYDSRWSFAALLGARWKNLVGRGSTTSLEMVLGSRVDILGSHTFASGFGSWLIPGIAGNYIDDYIYVSEEGQRTSRWGVRAGRAGLMAECAPAYWIRLMAGAGGEWYSIRPDIAPPGEPTRSGGLVFAGGDLWIDTLDRSWMPRTGISLRLSAQYFPEAADIEDDYYRASGRAVAAVPLLSRLSIRGTFIYGTAGGGTPLPHHRYYLGGILSWFDFFGQREVSFFGHEPFESSGANAWMGGADVQFEITGRWLAAGHFRVGSAMDDRDLLFKKGNALTGWAGTLAYDTPVGPAELVLSGSPGEDPYLWFGFGHRF